MLDEFFFVDYVAKGAPTEEKMQKDVEEKAEIHRHILVHSITLIPLDQF